MIPSYARYWWPMNEPPLPNNELIGEPIGNLKDWLPWELYPTLPRED